MSVEHEKRSAKRCKVHMPMPCRKLGEKALGHDNEIQILVRDISANGLAFESPTPYPVGALLLADMPLPNSKEPSATKLKVVRSEPLSGTNKYLIGVTFVDHKPLEKQKIEVYIGHLDLRQMLDAMLKSEASDLHLTVGCPPAIRVKRRIRFMDDNVIGQGEIESMLYPLLEKVQLEFFEKNKELNFTFSSEQNLRFRVNLHIQKGVVEATIRSIPHEIKNFEQLGLPVKPLENLCRQKTGLILITGKAGSGKTTTLAAMVDYINRNMENVVITIEDPIEYIHTSKKSIIKQRELGRDTQSSAAALKNALRQDPDAVMVGELLDSAAVLEAIGAAETGHLVMATVHAYGAAQAMERLVNLFPIEYSSVVAKKLAGCLNGTVSQILIPDVKGSLVVATELMISNTAVRNIIRDGRFEHLKTCLQMGSELGMHTMESSLRRLDEQQVIDLASLEPYLKNLSM